MSLEVYTNASKELPTSYALRKWEVKGDNVVKCLTILFHGMGHVVVMDNLFIIIITPA